jgi:mono/diheme cytochrome c family protein
MAGPGRRHIYGLLFLVSCLFVPGAVLSQETIDLPEGDGRDLVAAQCTTCHGLSAVSVKRASAEIWDETVSRMVTTYMAAISDGDRKRIVEYLSTNFGEGSSYSPGQQVVAEQCFRCHGEGMWKDLKTDRNGWLSAVYRMVGQGGVWTPEQINAIADYLSATYPAGEAE